MKPGSEGVAGLVEGGDPPRQARGERGCYVYCVARPGENVSLGKVGIGGEEVHTVVHREVCAVVHEGLAQPYQSGDQEVAASWVMEHHRVVEAAWRRWAAVVPLTFNTIVVGGDEEAAAAKLGGWMEAEYLSLKGKLDGLAEKGEYGLQVFWDARLKGEVVAQAVPECMELREAIASKSRGLAYMYSQKLERLIAQHVEAQAATVFKEVYGMVSRCVDGVVVEKVRAAPEGRTMVVNLSCLASAGRERALEEEVARIGSMDGLSVRLVGPLPPYSFC